jgi:hypothetical protein
MRKMTARSVRWLSAVSVTVPAVLILLFIYLLKVPNYFSYGLLITIFFSISMLLLLDMGKYVPIPLSVKKFILISVIMNIVNFFVKISGYDIESSMQFFVRLNNKMNPEGRKSNMLILLPRCLQDATCDKDLAADINNCVRCGKCQMKEILEFGSSRDLQLYMVGGGTLALQKIRMMRPKGIIAVACEKELVDGIKGALAIPVWAISNLRPEGPCRNTRVNIDELKDALNRYSAKNNVN